MSEEMERQEQTAESEERVMPEPVLLRDELERQRLALEAEKAAFEREKLTALVERELVNRGLAPEFAAFLTGADEAESLMRIEAFEGLFQEALRRELTRRLGDLSAPREPSKQKGFTRERLRQMSAGEINRNWEEIQRTLKG
jgi:hypothetical protein